MDTQISGNNGNKNITLNLDEFDIDSYDFKPVTKGLGFHEDKKNKVRPSSIQKTTSPVKSGRSLGTARKQVASSLGATSHGAYLQNTPTAITDNGLMSGIDAIYKNEQIRNEVPKKEARLKEASPFSMVGAFLLDLLNVSLISVGLFACFFFLIASTFEGEAFVSFIKTSWEFVSLISVLIFITYFSLLEPVGTPGKRFLGLATFQVGQQKRITLKNAFLRSIICLISLPLCAFPLIFDFQGKLTDSKVLRFKK
jgi:uncharacterized RDD family membrane protein YckC